MPGGPKPKRKYTRRNVPAANVPVNTPKTNGAALPNGAQPGSDEATVAQPQIENAANISIAQPVDGNQLVPEFDMPILLSPQRQQIIVNDSVPKTDQAQSLDQIARDAHAGLLEALQMADYQENQLLSHASVLNVSVPIASVPNASVPSASMSNASVPNASVPNASMKNARVSERSSILPNRYAATTFGSRLLSSTPLRRRSSALRALANFRANVENENLNYSAVTVTENEIPSPWVCN